MDWGKFSQAVHLSWTARGVSGNVPNLSTFLWDLGSRGPVVGFDRAVGLRVERKKSLIIAVGGKMEVYLIRALLLYLIAAHSPFFTILKIGYISLQYLFNISFPAHSLPLFYRHTPD